MSELKPCPFCGGNAIDKCGFYDYERYWIECQHCGASNYCKAYEGEAEAIAAWNKRSPEICPEILALAETMQFKLSKNKHKECSIMNPDSKGRGWKHCEPFWLTGRIRDELVELEQILEFHLLEPDKCSIEEVLRECADVANFAMMIHDNISNPARPIELPEGE